MQIRIQTLDSFILSFLVSKIGAVSNPNNVIIVEKRKHYVKNPIKVSHFVIKNGQEQ